ncbi:MAG: hypothetical protein SGBAC_011936 [Bacillariaceae sp.]
MNDDKEMQYADAQDDAGDRNDNHNNIIQLEDQEYYRELEQDLAQLEHALDLDDDDALFEMLDEMHERNIEGLDGFDESHNNPLLRSRFRGLHHTDATTVEDSEFGMSLDKPDEASWKQDESLFDIEEDLFGNEEAEAIVQETENQDAEEDNAGPERQSAVLKGLWGVGFGIDFDDSDSDAFDDDEDRLMVGGFHSAAYEAARAHHFQHAANEQTIDTNDVGGTTEDDSKDEELEFEWAIGDLLHPADVDVPEPTVVPATAVDEEVVPENEKSNLLTFVDDGDVALDITEDVDADTTKKSSKAKRNKTANLGSTALYSRTFKKPEYEDDEEYRNTKYDQYDRENLGDPFNLKPIVKPPLPPEGKDPYSLEHYTPDGGVVQYERTGEWSFDADGGYIPEVHPEKISSEWTPKKYHREDKKAAEVVDSRKRRTFEAYAMGDIFDQLDGNMPESQAGIEDRNDRVIQESLSPLDDSELHKSDSNDGETEVDHSGDLSVTKGLLHVALGQATDHAANRTGESSVGGAGEANITSTSSDRGHPEPPPLEEELISDDGESSEDSQISETSESVIDENDVKFEYAILQIQSFFRAAIAKRRTGTKKKGKKRLKRMGKKPKRGAIRIQALIRGVLQRRKYGLALAIMRRQSEGTVHDMGDTVLRPEGAAPDSPYDGDVIGRRLPRPPSMRSIDMGQEHDELDEKGGIRYTHVPEEIAVIIETSAREASKKSKLRAETLQFLDTLHGYLVCRGKMDAKYNEIDEFQIIAGHAIKADISDMRVSPDNPSLYSSQFQQQSIRGQPVKTLSELYEAAEQSKPIYQEIVKDIVRKFQSKHAETTVGMVVNLSELKGKQRAQEIAEDDYAKRCPKPGLSWLYDIVRGSIEFTSAHHVIEFLELIQQEPSITIVKAKNRFREPSLTGYRDLNIQFQVDTGKGFYHTCELQIHHKAIKELDEELRTHKFYEYFRSYFAGATHSLKDRLSVLKLICDGGAIDDSFLTELLQTETDIERLKRLGVLFRDQLCEYQWAFRVFVRLFEIQKDRYGTRHQTIAQAYIDIAMVLKERGKLEEAMLLYKESLDIYGTAYGNQHLTVADVYLNMALVLGEQEKLSESMDLFQQSLAIMTSDLGEESLAVANTYNYMATVLRKQGKLESAMELLKKSLGIKRLVLGEVDSSIADTLQNIAIISRLNGKLKESANLFQESIDIATKCMGENHPSVAFGYRNMAVVLEKQEKPNAALELYCRSLDIYKAYLGEKHVVVANIYTDMACLYMSRGDHGKAKGLVKRSFSIKKELSDSRLIESGLRKKIVNQRSRSQNTSAISRRSVTV